MSSIRGLLLLPLPPQRATYSHIRTALYPSIRSTISSVAKAGRTNDTSVLEIAVPLTRLSEETHTHQELFVRVNPLVASLYQLIATICAELGIPHTGAGSVDVRVLFVQDEIDSPDGESDEKTSPFASLTYAALAVSNRQWTHVFAVESEQGEQTFKRFWAIAREHGPNRGDLFTRVRRVASGMQIYIPDALDVDFDVDLDSALAGRLKSRKIVVEISGVVADQFTDKYLLTMALFAIPQSENEPQAPTGEWGRGAGHVIVVSSKEVLDGDLKRRISDFFATATGKTHSSHAQTEQEDDDLQLTFTTFDEMDYTTGGLSSTRIVSDGNNGIINGRDKERAKSGAEIVLRPIRPANKDIDD
ncbi:hypothetical protein F5Y10DRAFT_43267 [Nemania abortiva]|nr:hypothetical protein F5Y10DRAFT_43267 [Nemania abortiva]